MRSDPSALRWLIGVQLTNYRKRAGQTMTAAATAIGCTAGKIGHLESGRNQQQPAEITGLLRFYGADLADIERLASLAGSADRQTWWAPWTDVVPDWLRTFVGLEGLASHVANYSPSVFHALLQTEDYSLGVTTGSGRVRPDHHERTVSLSTCSRSPSETTSRYSYCPPRSVPTTGWWASSRCWTSPPPSPSSTWRSSTARSTQDQQQVAGYARIVDRLRAAALSPARTAEVIRSRLSALS